jgi:hypothetical protein
MTKQCRNFEWWMTTDHETRDVWPCETEGANSTIDPSTPSDALAGRGEVMETFTLALGGWIGRAFGRNPLVRTGDRIEAMLLMLAVTAALIAAPIAGAIGTAVYDTRSHEYAEQAMSRHTVAAKAIEDSTTSVRPNSDTITVAIRWRIDGIEHTGSVALDQTVQAGDSLTIWVDRDGNYVAPPTPASQAGSYAVGIGVLTWLGAVVATVTFTALLRSRLNRLRSAKWDREFKTLADDDGGRTNKHS